MARKAQDSGAALASITGWPWLALLPVLAVLGWYFLPATGADFVADDYVFLATGRMVDTPLAAFWQSHFYEPYYFRPIGVISWWLATRAFGLDYASHSVVNALLHVVNAALFFALLRALTLRTSASVAGTYLFALGPFALATILWPSNRFDLLAVAFLLLQANCMVRALRGNRLALWLAALAALAACWSKELAYPVATVMACVGLLASEVPWRRRITLFAMLGVAIGSAFAVRQAVVVNAFVLASVDPVGQIVGGAGVLLSALPRLAGLIAGDRLSIWIGGALLAAIVMTLIAGRRDHHHLNGLLGGVTLIWLAAFIVQTPLAKGFVAMLDSGPFGVITFARFYYALSAVTCVLLAVVLARGRGRVGSVAAVIVVAVATVAGVAARPLAESFARWTQTEVRPVAIAATTIVDQAGESPCVFVLLGTETAHPYFRMFSDVTVKARTTSPEKTWRCHVMTESTPWLFAFPSSVAPLELALRPVPSFGGLAKPDSTWSSIRYRYRLPTNDPAKLPGARFFEWRTDQFIEVTRDVQRGERKLRSHDW